MQTYNEWCLVKSSSLAVQRPYFQKLVMYQTGEYVDDFSLNPNASEDKVTKQRHEKAQDVQEMRCTSLVCLLWKHVPCNAITHNEGN